jgi:NTE family protein
MAVKRFGHYLNADAERADQGVQQHMQPIENLVFSGGGIKGVAHAGAVRAMDRLGALASVRRVAGSSAGALSAMAMACGYTADDMLWLAGLPNFQYFKDDSLGIVRDLYRLFTSYGIYKGEALERYIAMIPVQTGLSPDITFADLRRLAAEPSSSRAYRELSVPAVNLTTQRLVVFDADSSPNMPVAEAVRMSASLPLFWPSVVRKGQHMVDAGLLCNCPVHLFDSREPCGKRIPNPGTMGVFLGTSPQGNPCPVEIKDLMTYLLALVELLTEHANRAHVKAIDWARMAFVDCGSIRATDFSLDEGERRRLVDAGDLAMSRALESRSREA